jgi:hypothetical protein
LNAYAQREHLQRHEEVYRQWHRDPPPLRTRSQSASPSCCDIDVERSAQVNFYQTDGTYQGNAEDFKAGWAAVASACKRISPSTQMFFTPNVANLDEYKRFIPDDTSTIDLYGFRRSCSLTLDRSYLPSAGIDFYPKSVGDTTFVDTMKPLHDLLTSNGKTKVCRPELAARLRADVVRAHSLPSARPVWASLARRRTASTG